MNDVRPTHGISARKRFAFLLATLALVLGLVEIGVRVADWRREARRAARPPLAYSIRGETSKGQPLVEKRAGLSLIHDPYLVYRTKPHQRSEGLTLAGEHATVRVNARGFRGEDFPLEKPAGARRVLVLGGSAAFGQGATADDRAVAGGLQRLLNEKGDAGGKVHVVNAATIGYSSTQELVHLATELLELAPDVIVLFDGWNDFFFGASAPDVEPVSPMFAQYEQFIERGADRVRSALRLSALYRSIERKGARTAEGAPATETGAARPGAGAAWTAEWTGGRENPRALAAYRRNLERILRLARAHGARVVFAPQPEILNRPNAAGRDREMQASAPGDYAKLAREWYPRFIDAAREVARGEGGSFVDCAAVLAEVREDVFEDGVHLNDRGYEAVARGIAPAVAEALAAR